MWVLAAVGFEGQGKGAGRRTARGFAEIKMEIFVMNGTVTRARGLRHVH